jgi:hypothetical protein
VAKCIFDSEWSPCEFCRSRNIRTVCVKLPAAKAAGPSRPLPTAIDAILNPDDALLLAFAYSNSTRPTRFHGVNAFIKILGGEYGPSLHDPTLRHAIIALSSFGLPSAQFSPSLTRHKERAWELLEPQFESRNTATEASVFAIFILMFLDRDTKAPLYYLETVRKCKVMLNSLSAIQRLHPLITVFSAYISDCLDCDEMLRLSLRSEISEWSLPPPTTLTQRAQYFNEFRRIDPWFAPGSTEANNLTSCSLIERSICCIYRAIRRGCSIDIELSLRQLCHETRDLERHIPGSQNRDELFITSPFEAERLSCIHLAISLLKAPSILWGTCTTEVVSIAKALVVGLQQHSPRTRGLLNTFTITIYRGQILLAAIVFPPAEIDEGIILVMTLIL